MPTGVLRSEQQWRNSDTSRDVATFLRVGEGREFENVDALRARIKVLDQECGPIPRK